MRSTKIIKNCSYRLCTCLHHMVILRTQNKITDFLMILAWTSPFKKTIRSSHKALVRTSYKYLLARHSYKRCTLIHHCGIHHCGILPITVEIKVLLLSPVALSCKRITVPEGKLYLQMGTCKLIEDSTRILYYPNHL